jgi:hypothetical protein
MPGAMTCRVPEGLSVSIQHLSTGLRPKADVGPPNRGPQPHLAPGKPARTRSQIGENAFARAIGGENATGVEPSLRSGSSRLADWYRSAGGFADRETAFGQFAVHFRASQCTPYGRTDWDSDVNPPVGTFRPRDPKL